MWIETYTPKWHASVVALGDRVFGQGYFSRLSEVAAEAKALMLLSLEKDKLCGFVQGRCDTGEFRCVDRSERCSCEAVFYRKAIY